MRGRRSLSLPLLLIILTGAGLASEAAELVRVQFAPQQLPGVQAALEAAASSGKPVYVYIYAIRDSKCTYMEEKTLSNPPVLAALRSYQVCAVNIHNPDDHSFLQQHKVLPATDEERRIKTYRLPTHLFLNSSGQAVYRCDGYLPGEWFTRVLENVTLLIKAQAAVQDNPQDARAYAQLGHIWLVLQNYDKAREYLNKAVSLDPNNEVGAKAEAGLDLAIMAIPDNPQQAYNDLANYEQTYPHSPQRLEARYYMAVALVAADNIPEAIKILESFETDDKSAPEYDSPWTPNALGLLRRLRQYVAQ